MKKKEKSLWVRILISLSSLAILGAGMFVFFAGFNLIATLVLVTAAAGIVGPAIAYSDGIFDAIVGLFEVFFEGIAAIFEAIGSIFGSIFDF